MALATKPKTGNHSRKRTGKHHKHSKTYVKHYWPYLPMMMMVVIGIAINSFWTTQTRVLGTTSDISRQTLLVNTNSERAAQKQTALTQDAQLTAAAQAKAADMASHDYWSHTSPDGKTPWTFIESAGYPYEQAGENLAYGFTDAGSTITGWMNSREHRANILNHAYTEVGFGIAQSKSFQGHGPTTIIVAMYGKPLPAVATIRFSVPEQSGTVSSKTLGATSQAQPASQLVSRVQLLTGGQAPWSLLALSAVAGAALTFFLIRHGRRLHKAITRGEHYALAHPAYDFAVVAVIVVGFILTRSSGVIR